MRRLTQFSITTMFVLMLLASLVFAYLRPYYRQQAALDKLRSSGEAWEISCDFYFADELNQDQTKVVSNQSEFSWLEARLGIYLRPITFVIVKDNLDNIENLARLGFVETCVIHPSINFSIPDQDSLPEQATINAFRQQLPNIEIRPMTQEQASDFSFQSILLVPIQDLEIE